MSNLLLYMKSYVLYAYVVQIIFYEQCCKSYVVYLIYVSDRIFEQHSNIGT